MKSNKNILTEFNLPDDSQTSLEKGLRKAAFNKKIEALKYFINVVHNIDAQDTNPESKKTALHLALEKNAISAIKILLDSNAAFTFPNAQGKSAFELALDHKHPEVIKLFEERIKFLMEAARDSSTWLETIIMQFGYKSDKRGICVGVAGMSIAPCLLGTKGINALNNRYMLLFQIYLSALSHAERKLNLRQQNLITIEEYLSKCEAALSNTNNFNSVSLLNEYFKTIKFLLKLQDSISLQDEKSQYDYLNKQFTRTKELLDGEIHLQIIDRLSSSISRQQNIDIFAFLDGVDIFQNVYPHLLPKEKHVLAEHQDVLCALELTTCKQIEDEYKETKSQEKDIGLLIQSVNKSFSGFYLKDSLENYFYSLKKHVQHPFVLRLDSLNHGITVSFNFENNNWVFINSTPPLELSTLNELTEKVMHCFSKNDVVIFKTEVYCKRIDFENVNKEISAWMSSPEFITIHKVNSDKINLTDSNGATYLHIAVKAADENKIQELIANGADVNAFCNDGFSSFHLAINRNEVAISKMLLPFADLEKPSTHPFTPFYLACLSGTIDIAKDLAAKDVKLNVKANDGSTPLHAAAYNGHEEVVEFLIDKLQINEKDADGMTPLFVASFKGHAKVVELLILKGANPSLTCPLTPDVLKSYAKNDIQKSNILKFIDSQPNVESFEISPQTIAMLLGHEEVLKKFTPETNLVNHHFSLFNKFNNNNNIDVLENLSLKHE